MNSSNPDAANIKEECVLDPEELNNTIHRIAFEVLERHPNQEMAFVGIHTGGVYFANRVFEVVHERNPNILQGTLDITLYRDDLDNLGTIPRVKGSDLPFDVENQFIVLLDDVLYTGRTVRAAIDELMDYGRPSRIELAVLIDRGNRELPIAPDYTGRFIKTDADEYISVRFGEQQEPEGVFMLRETDPSPQQEP